MKNQTKRLCSLCNKQMLTDEQTILHVVYMEEDAPTITCCDECAYNENSILQCDEDSDVDFSEMTI